MSGTPDRSAERAEAARLLALFEAAGGVRVETDILQPAETLLDLYGEDIRARAFTTAGPGGGEWMLRPDFTVPVVRMHMEGGAERARYAYAGKVFRRQEDAPERASEYFQAGFEIFGGDDPAATDAEVFALIHDILAPLGAQVTTGDIGLVTAAVNGLACSDRRKAALLRHVWRPRRFRMLLERFSGRLDVPPARAALLAAVDPMEGAGPEIGLRSRAEVLDRIEALRADAADPPIPAAAVVAIDDILSMKTTATRAVARLRGIALDLPAIAGAVDRLEARLDALSAQGVALDELAFEASHGRSSMEYYDGFVFSFTRPDLPGAAPLATGGRYDALTAVLGGGPAVPAVGGVIRPAQVVAMASPC